MIVTTRYRDIPWEEARKCFKMESGAYRETRDGEHWDKLRGRPVQIYTPPVAERQWQFVTCDGPFFEVADGGRNVVCPHIAFIGD